jgi:hypothetical protein
MLSTFCAMAILIVGAFIVASFIYPATMMQLSYDLGNDRGCLRYARRAYDASGDVYYIAYAMEVAIGMNDTEEIAACASAFLEDESFESYCMEWDEENALNTEISGLGYKQYIGGRLAVAKYSLGEKQQAVDVAFSVNTQSFEKNNAVVALLLTAVQKEGATGETVVLIADRLGKLTLPDGADESYLNELRSLLN